MTAPRSRVFRGALILQIDGRSYVIDTASTAGIVVQGMTIRAHPLAAGENVELGVRRAVVRWRPVH